MFLYPLILSSLSFVSFNVFVNDLVASYGMCCFLSIGCSFVRLLYVDEHSEVQAPGRVLGNAERLAKGLRLFSQVILYVSVSERTCVRCLDPLFSFPFISIFIPTVACLFIHETLYARTMTC